MCFLYFNQAMGLDAYLSSDGLMFLLLYGERHLLGLLIELTDVKLEMSDL